MKNPDALAASIGRAKYGEKKMESLSENANVSGRRRNPR